MIKDIEALPAEEYSSLRNELLQNKK